MSHSLAEQSMVSLGRGLSILTAIADHGEISAAALSQMLGIPASTVYRHLSVLGAHGLVEDDRGWYTAGWRAVAMSGRNLTHTVLAVLATDVLIWTESALQETVGLAVRTGSHAVCLRQTRGRLPDHVSFRIDVPMPLCAGAGARVILAHSPPSLIDTVMARGAVCATGRTWDVTDLRVACEQIRRRGYETGRDEPRRGSIAVAVPVCLRGEIVAALSAAGPACRCERPGWVDRAHRLLGQAATTLVDRLQAADEDQHARPARSAPGPASDSIPARPPPPSPPPSKE